MAADSLMTWGSERHFGHDKLRSVVSAKGVRAVLAVSGSGAVVDALAQWWCDGAKPDAAPKLGGDNAWTMLAVTAGGLAVYTDKVPYALAVSAPFALGAGRDYAMGAMKQGASPRRAVEIACELDVCSGGDIRVKDLAVELGLAPPERRTESTFDPVKKKNIVRMKKLEAAE